MTREEGVYGEEYVEPAGEDIPPDKPAAGQWVNMEITQGACGHVWCNRDSCPICLIAELEQYLKERNLEREMDCD